MWAGLAPLDTGKEGEPSLRRAAAGKLLIGVGGVGRMDTYSDAERALIPQHFDVITPGNAMKWQHLERKQGEYNFRAADSIVDFAQQHQLKVLGHCLLFNRNGNYPRWLFRDGQGPASPKLVRQRVRKHIHTLADRYKDRVYAWDVMNEAITEKEPFFRDTDWTQTFGFNMDFVRMAFEYAHEAAPKALHVYNDYQVENPKKLERVLMLVDDLREAGTPVDVVGIQGHWELDLVPFEKIEQAIIALHRAGVRTAITELDIDVIPRNLYWNPKTRPEAIKQDPYREGCPEEILQRQAEQYGKLFAIIARHADKVERVTLWGLTDKHSWLNTWPWKRQNHALLFDRQVHPKPAFDAVVKSLRGLDD